MGVPVEHDLAGGHGRVEADTIRPARGEPERDRAAELVAEDERCRGEVGLTTRAVMVTLPGAESGGGAPWGGLGSCGPEAVTCESPALTVSPIERTAG